MKDFPIFLLLPSNACTWLAILGNDLSPFFTEKAGQVRFQSVPVDISLSTAKTDDAYDFNTDFK